MTASLLYREEEHAIACGDPDQWCDLHIDAIVGAVIEGREAYELDALYRTAPTHEEDILFRQDIARDLGQKENQAFAESFLRPFQRARRAVATGEEAREREAAAKWRLDGALAYCEAVTALAGGGGSECGSEGLRRAREWAGEYARTEAFVALQEEAAALERDFAAYRYGLTLDIAGGRVILSSDDGAGDFTAGLLEVFGRYDLSAARREPVAFADTRLNTLERRLLALLIEGNAALFARLLAFAARFPDFIDMRFRELERQLLFYLTYLSYAKSLEAMGHRFALPTFSADRALSVAGGYDLSLAQLGKGRVVSNDLDLKPDERILLLTGPNQGGKTTFARMLGQILFFARLGLPVPCERADLPAVRGVFTHFAREEEAGSNAGRLQEELIRLSRMLPSVWEDGVVILNELFASATSYDACEMGARLLNSLAGKGCICLFVSHVARLADAVPGMVSLIATMSEDDSPVPTFRVERRPPAAGAHALRLLRKHRLTKEEIEVRTHAAFAAL